MKKIGIHLLAGLIIGVLSAFLIIGIKPTFQFLKLRHNPAANEHGAINRSTDGDGSSDVRSRPMIGQMLTAKTSSLGDLPLDSENSSTRAENFEKETERLRKLNRQLQTQLAEILSWMLANYKGRYPLAENQITNLSFHAITDTFNLNPAIAEFMHLQSNEVAMINDLLSYGGDMVNDLAASNISVTESDTGKVVLHIPPFPEEGATLREDLYSALEATLGPYRFDRFMDVTTGKFDADFQYFGDASHTIIFEPVYSETDESLQWRIRDGWIIQEEDSSKTIKATESVVRVVPDEYYKYIHYLPAYLFATDETEK